MGGGGDEGTRAEAKEAGTGGGPFDDVAFVGDFCCCAAEGRGEMGDLGSEEEPPPPPIVRMGGGGGPDLPCAREPLFGFAGFVAGEIGEAAGDAGVVVEEVEEAAAGVVVAAEAAGVVEAAEVVEEVEVEEEGTGGGEAEAPGLDFVAPRAGDPNGVEVQLSLPAPVPFGRAEPGLLSVDPPEPPPEGAEEEGTGGGPPDAAVCVVLLDVPGVLFADWSVSGTGGGLTPPAPAPATPIEMELCADELRVCLDFCGSHDGLSPSQYATAPRMAETHSSLSAREGANMT